MRHAEQKTRMIWLDSRAMPNSGIGRYINTLAAVAGNVLPECQLCTWKDSFSRYAGKRISPFLAGCRLFYELFIMPFVLKRNHVTIFHCTKNFGLPVFSRCKKILTVHDLIPLDLKEYARGLSRLYYYLNYRISCHGADRIICSSEFTKERLLHHFPEVSSKIRVVYLGASKFFPPGNQTETQTVPAENPYILMMGGAEPRKNICFAANSILADERFRQYDLFIIGSAWHEKVLPENITDDPRVHCIENVPDARLGELYRHASVLVFPSVYEGFGLPVFEAAVFRIPVLAANASVIPEFLSMPEMLFESDSGKNLCEKLDQILRSETLRTRIVSEMEKLLQKFSWDKTISETFSVYRELLD